MPIRRGSMGMVLSSQQRQMRFRAAVFRLPVISLLLFSVVAPILFLASRRAYSSFSPGKAEFLEFSINNTEELSKSQALNKIENLFPNEVLNVIDPKIRFSPRIDMTIKNEESPPSSLSIQNLNGKRSGILQEEAHDGRINGWQSVISTTIGAREALNVPDWKTIKRDQWDDIKNGAVDEDIDGKYRRQKIRMERREMRAGDLISGKFGANVNLKQEAADNREGLSSSLHTRYSVWHKENEESDSLVRIMRDQLIMAKVYASLANAQDDADLSRELNARMKENRRIMGEANVDSDLPHRASEKARTMGELLSKARTQLYDCKSVIRKLRAMLQGSEDLTRILYKQTAVLRQLVAKTIPKGLHCLSMLLMSEYNALPKDERIFPGREKLEDPNLFHYALFSDNVIAAAVVVNSTIVNAKEPNKHVFHLVTDKLNYAAMRMWFLANPPGQATIDVQNIDDFEWLNASYCPVLHQLQSASMKEYYFMSDQPATLADASSNLKYRNPKYLSMLNHLRFYLPEIFPKLEKILFLDDDIVVQQDLSDLWSIELNGCVNGAVETCGESFHRFDKYLNFSNPLISENFDPNACGWAYGMNIFDLNTWRMHDLTRAYHKWQTLNKQRELWKLGTLPPGLITFYNLTRPLDRRWHVLGLGYDANMEMDDMENAAVLHYNGNMKPWLELAITKYKPFWTKYVDHDQRFLQHCNIHF